MLTLSVARAQTYELKSDLPCIYINTFNNQGINSKDVYVYATMNYVDEDGHVSTYDSLQIRGRGNSTWGLRKKPYRIKFHEKEKFLGKGYAKARSWTLLANCGDKSLIRNAITSAMGEFLGLKFNPAAKFVDLVLNNVYMGNYQISDQVDIRPHRVNIVEQDVPLQDGADISGGYLLEVDGFQDGNCFVTNNYRAPVRIHKPDDEDIVASQNRWIRDYVNQFDQALYSSDFADPVKGYRRFVDSTSLANWYIATEVSANVDGFYSTYFYKDQADSLLYWGPLWDYDIAYNNDWRTDHGSVNTTNSLMADVAYSGSKAWVNRMWSDPWFSRLINRRYQQALDDGLVYYLDNKIDSLAQLLDASQQLNYRKWGINTRMYHEVTLYSSYKQYIQDLKDFIGNHTAYLKTAFANKKPAEPTPAFQVDNYYYRIINANTSNAMEGNSVGNVYAYYNQADRDAEEWIIRQQGDYYQVVNKTFDQALNDPSPTTAVGTQLSLATPDASDERQLWEFIPQGTAGYYNLRNVYTNHIVNLQGGNSSAYTPILSYTNDARNATSMNRLWYIRASGALPQEYTGITDVEPEEYALAYNRDLQQLHFGSETPSQLNFQVSVYDMGGRRVGTFRASESFSMSQLPAGVYIVSWTTGGHHRSVKFSK